MQCVICNQKTDDGEFCALHKGAHGNLIRGYESWVKAMEIPWESYLDAVAKNPSTGLWVKEVVEYLKNKEIGRK
jgi:hypothetical protein